MTSMSYNCCKIVNNIDNWFFFFFSALANLPGLEIEGCVIKIEPAMERRNRSAIRPRHVAYGAPGATPAIGNRQTEFPLRILVHSDMVGAIIGRGGSTIRQITQQTRAR